MFILNKYCLLTISVFIVSGLAVINNTNASESKVTGTHTTHLPLELEPSSFNNSQSFQIAAIRPIGTGDEFTFSDHDKNDFDSNSGATKCRNKGFNTTSCPPAQILQNRCSYHPAYYKSCSCPTTYKTCSVPEYGVGEACNNQYASCARDDARACKEQNSAYVNNCPSGWQLQDSPKCSYNSGYGICCNKCSGYDYTAVPDGYLQDGAACNSCSGTKIKIKINHCDGYTACEYGPQSGASACLSGSTLKYNKCKACTENPCNDFTLTQCPQNAVCESCTKGCGNTTPLYKIKSCANGTSLQGNTCVDNCQGYDLDRCPLYSVCSHCPYNYNRYKFEKCNECATLSDGKCVNKSPLLPIYYSDGTQSSELIKGKEPIGVVFENKHVISLIYGLAPWGVKDNANIPNITKYSSKSTAVKDMDGKKNTQALLSYFGNDARIVYHASNYSTAGTRVGQWYLPSLGQVQQIYDNRCRIAATMEKATGQTSIITINMGNSTSSGIISSTVDENNTGWVLFFYRPSYEPISYTNTYVDYYPIMDL